MSRPHLSLITRLTLLLPILVTTPVHILYAHTTIFSLSLTIALSYWAKPEHGLEVSQFLNDHLAEVCKKYPTKFIGLGTIPLQVSFRFPYLVMCFRNVMNVLKDADGVSFTFEG